MACATPWFKLSAVGLYILTIEVCLAAAGYYHTCALLSAAVSSAGATIAPASWGQQRLAANRRNRRRLRGLPA